MCLRDATNGALRHPVFDVPLFQYVLGVKRQRQEEQQGGQSDREVHGRIDETWNSAPRTDSRVPIGCEQMGFSKARRFARTARLLFG